VGVLKLVVVELVELMELVGRLCFVEGRRVFVIAGRLVELVLELVVGRGLVELVVVELVILVGRLCLLNGRIVV